MPQTLMWEGHKQSIIIVENMQTTVILFIILLRRKLIKVIGEPVLELNTGILKCQVPSSSSSSVLEVW